MQYKIKCILTNNIESLHVWLQKVRKTIRHCIWKIKKSVNSNIISLLCIQFIRCVLCFLLIDSFDWLKAISRHSANNLLTKLMHAWWHELLQYSAQVKKGNTWQKSSFQDPSKKNIIISIDCFCYTLFKGLKSVDRVQILKMKRLQKNKNSIFILKWAQSLLV